MAKRVLIIGSIKSVYINDLYNNISSSICQVDILDIINAVFKPGGGTVVNLFNSNSSLLKVNLLKKIIKYRSIKKFINSLGTYDCVSIHYIDPVYGLLFSKSIKKLGYRIIASVWGTDFHGVSFIIKHFQKKIYNISDYITFNNESVLQEFSQYYSKKYDEKLKILRFGLSSLEEIKKVKLTKSQICNYFGIPADSFIVTCGYNGSPNQNHKSIINALNQLKAKMPENTVIVIPMTYNSRVEYVDMIEKLLKDTGYNFIILKKFLTYPEMAYIRCMTDIFIHVQTHDSFSASMQEHLFAGNIVVNGSWLPYQSIKEKGVFFIEVNDLEELKTILGGVVERIDQIKMACSKNAAIIWNLSSWDSNLKDWQAFLDI